MTDTDIYSLANGTHWKVPFAAVNKDQIVSMIDAFIQFPNWYRIRKFNWLQYDTGYHK